MQSDRISSVVASAAASNTITPERTSIVAQQASAIVQSVNNGASPAAVQEQIRTSVPNKEEQKVVEEAVVEATNASVTPETVTDAVEAIDKTQRTAGTHMLSYFKQLALLGLLAAGMYGAGTMGGTTVQSYMGVEPARVAFLNQIAATITNELLTTPNIGMKTLENQISQATVDPTEQAVLGNAIMSNLMKAGYMGPPVANVVYPMTPANMTAPVPGTSPIRRTSIPTVGATSMWSPAPSFATDSTSYWTNVNPVPIPGLAAYPMTPANATATYGTSPAASPAAAPARSPSPATGSTALWSPFPSNPLRSPTRRASLPTQRQLAQALSPQPAIVPIPVRSPTPATGSTALWNPFPSNLVNISPQPLSPLLNNQYPMSPANATLSQRYGTSPVRAQSPTRRR